MTHLIHNATNKPNNVLDDWLGANAKVIDFASRAFGERAATRVRIGPNMAVESGTAQFDPKHDTIEMNTDYLAPGMEPSEVAPFDELFRAKRAPFMGALFHELAHKRYSKWVPTDLPTDRFGGRLTEVLVALEESRIERRAIKRYRSAREYIPHTALQLIVKEFKGGGDPYSMSIATALMLLRARVDILTEADVRDVRAEINEVLTRDQVDRLLDLGMRYHDLPFNNYVGLDLDGMESIAREWMEVLGLDADEAKNAEEAVLEAHGDGEGGEGGEGREGGEGGIAEAAARAEHDREMRQATKVRKVKIKRALEARKDGEQAAKDAESRSRGKVMEHIPGIGEGVNVGHASWMTPREPTASERVAAQVLGRKLEEVIGRGVAKDEVKRRVPDRRISMRGVIQHHVQEARGRVPDAARFRGKRLRETEELPLKIGTAVDISGSMNTLAEPLASTAYVVGNAAHFAGADFASVAFGKHVTGVVRKGRAVKSVPVIDPRDPHENFTDAFYVLENELDWLRDDDALRIFIMASDGCFVNPDHRRFADTWIPKMRERGIIVLHLDFENGAVSSYYDSEYNARHGNDLAPLVIDPRLEPAAVARTLGDYIVKVARAELRRRAAM